MKFSLRKSEKSLAKGAFCSLFMPLKQILPHPKGSARAARNHVYNSL